MISVSTQTELYIDYKNILLMKQPDSKGLSSGSTDSNRKEQVYNISISGSSCFQEERSTDGTSNLYPSLHPFPDDQSMAVSNVTYQVDENCLLVLFRYCFQCHKEATPSVYEKCGTRVTIRAKCPDGHFVLWDSVNPWDHIGRQNYAEVSAGPGAWKSDSDSQSDDDITQEDSPSPSTAQAVSDAVSTVLRHKVGGRNEGLDSSMDDSICVKEEPEFEPLEMDDADDLFQSGDANSEFAPYEADVPNESEEMANVCMDGPSNSGTQKRTKSKPRSFWSSETLKAAANAVKNGVSIRAVAKQFKIPRSTLQLRLKTQDLTPPLRGLRHTFSSEEEDAFAAEIVQMSKLFEGVTPEEIKKAAFHFAKINKIPNRFNKGNETAGDDWLNSFLKRHPQIYLKEPSGSQYQPHQCFQ